MASAYENPSTTADTDPFRQTAHGIFSIGNEAEPSTAPKAKKSLRLLLNPTPLTESDWSPSRVNRLLRPLFSKLTALSDWRKTNVSAARQSDKSGSKRRSGDWRTVSTDDEYLPNSRDDFTAAGQPIRRITKKYSAKGSGQAQKLADPLPHCRFGQDDFCDKLGGALCSNAPKSTDARAPQEQLASLRTCMSSTPHKLTKDIGEALENILIQTTNETYKVAFETTNTEDHVSNAVASIVAKRDASGKRSDIKDVKLTAGETEELNKQIETRNQTRKGAPSLRYLAARAVGKNLIAAAPSSEYRWIRWSGSDDDDDNATPTEDNYNFVHENHPHCLPIVTRVHAINTLEIAIRQGVIDSKAGMILAGICFRYNGLGGATSGGRSLIEAVFDVDPVRAILGTRLYLLDQPSHSGHCHLGYSLLQDFLVNFVRGYKFNKELKESHLHCGLDGITYILMDQPPKEKLLGRTPEAWNQDKEPLFLRIVRDLEGATEYRQDAMNLINCILELSFGIGGDLYQADEQLERRSNTDNAKRLHRRVFAPAVKELGSTLSRPVQDIVYGMIEWIGRRLLIQDNWNDDIDCKSFETRQGIYAEIVLNLVGGFLHQSDEMRAVAERSLWGVHGGSKKGAKAANYDTYYPKEAKVVVLLFGAVILSKIGVQNSLVSHNYSDVSVEAVLDLIDETLQEEEVNHDARQEGRNFTETLVEYMVEFFSVEDSGAWNKISAEDGCRGMVMALLGLSGEYIQHTPDSAAMKASRETFASSPRKPLAGLKVIGHTFSYVDEPATTNNRYYLTQFALSLALKFSSQDRLKHDPYTYHWASGIEQEVMRRNLHKPTLKTYRTRNGPARVNTPCYKWEEGLNEWLLIKAKETPLKPVKLLKNSAAMARKKSAELAKHAIWANKVSAERKKQEMEAKQKKAAEKKPPPFYVKIGLPKQFDPSEYVPGDDLTRNMEKRAEGVKKRASDAFNTNRTPKTKYKGAPVTHIYEFSPQSIRQRRSLESVLIPPPPRQAGIREEHLKIRLRRSSAEQQREGKRARLRNNRLRFMIKGPVRRRFEMDSRDDRHISSGEDIDYESSGNNADEESDDGTIMESDVDEVAIIGDEGSGDGKIDGNEDGHGVESGYEDLSEYNAIESEESGQGVTPDTSFSSMGYLKEQDLSLGRLTRARTHVVATKSNPTTPNRSNAALFAYAYHSTPTRPQKYSAQSDRKRRRADEPEADCASGIPFKKAKSNGMESDDENDEDFLAPRSVRNSESPYKRRKQPARFATNYKFTTSRVEASEGVYSSPPPTPPEENQEERGDTVMSGTEEELQDKDHDSVGFDYQGHLSGNGLHHYQNQHCFEEDYDDELGKDVNVITPARKLGRPKVTRNLWTPEPWVIERNSETPPAPPIHPACKGVSMQYSEDEITNMKNSGIGNMALKARPRGGFISDGEDVIRNVKKGRIEKTTPRGKENRRMSGRLIYKANYTGME